MATTQTNGKCKNSTPPKPKPLDQSIKIGVGDNVVDIALHAKLYRAPTKGFCSPYSWFSVPSGVTSFLTVFGFLQLSTAYTPKLIFTNNTPKDVVPTNNVPFEGPNDDNQYLDP